MRSKKNYPLINQQADVMFSVQMDAVKSIHWPKQITEKEQIGSTTAAILDGVTEKIAEGTEILSRKGAGSQHAEGVKESRNDNNFDVFLL